MPPNTSPNITIYYSFGSLHVVYEIILLIVMAFGRLEKYCQGCIDQDVSTDYWELWLLLEYQNLRLWDELN